MEKEKKVILPVTGMSCFNCATTIENNIRKLSGVMQVFVDFASEKLSVTYDSVLLNENDIITNVRRIGYGVAVGKIDLPVIGMHDDIDAVTLEKILLSHEGVLHVCISYGTERASIEYVPGMISIAEIATIVRKSGFDIINTEESEDAEDVESRIRNSALARQKHLLILGLIFTIPLIIYSMLLDFKGINFEYERFYMLIAASVVQFIVGWQFYVGAYKSLRAGSANMDVLIMLGSSIAYFSSFVVTIGMLKDINVYFETSATIITLIMMGKYLESRAKSKTSEALKALVKLGAKTAFVVRDHVATEVSIEEVEVGDLLIVYPGAKIPVDGIIYEGHTELDESMITGESMPVSKGPGDEVISATINKEGLFKFEASKVGKNTTLANIIRMVHEAQVSKAPIQKLADEIGRYFVPIIIGISILTFFGWIGFVHADWTVAVMNAIAVLVIACPCAIGLATPTAIIVGTSKGAENGILFKNSEVLERLGKANIILLDKTGTITQGQPEVTDIRLLSDSSFEEILRLAASAELGSEHPLGKSIVLAAQKKELSLVSPKQFKAVSGFGIQAIIEEQVITVGNLRMILNEGISAETFKSDLLKLQSEGNTEMIVTARNIKDNGPAKPLGIIVVRDTLKPGAVDVIRTLRQSDLDVRLITGDNQSTADAIARQVGIDYVLAEVLPGGKVDVVKKIQTSPFLNSKNNPIVVMVGDGINDAPALAQADIGIALGTGSDIAIAAAGITLISGDLSGITHAISLSRGTSQTIIQNFVWALLYNIILIPVAALGLLNPMLAAGAMAFSSIFVVTNSLRLRSFHFKTLNPRKTFWRQIFELTL